VDALLEAVKASPELQVYIMPWNNPSQVETYSAATERVFAAMNTHLKAGFYVQRADSKSGMMFSHHQKCVIVDEKVLSAELTWPMDAMMTIMVCRQMQTDDRA
jgi:phospholipase D1/2